MERPNFEDFRAKNPKETTYMINRMYIGKLEEYINHLESSKIYPKVDSSFIFGTSKRIPVEIVKEEKLKCDCCHKMAHIVYTITAGRFCVECLPNYGIDYEIK